MAVDDGIYDIRDLPDLLDDLDTNPFPNFNEYTESQLCIPQDPIEDLEWYPNFANDIISLNGISLTPEHETIDFSIFCDFLPSNEPENIPITVEQKTEEQVPLKDYSSKSEERVPLKDYSSYDYRKRGIDHNTSFTNKKQRSKRLSKGAWSIKNVFFASENEEPSIGLEKLRRRCTHCLTDKTPQWRVGPMGPKTLCNACGVRYKSGRLVPEYRPAASPTFDFHKHSNFHKKILKKRFE